MASPANQGGGNLSVLRAQLPVPHSQVCEQSCAALCVLALRKPENSRVIVEGGGALAALQAMKAHPQEAGVQVSVAVLPRAWDLRLPPSPSRCLSGEPGVVARIPVPKKQEDSHKFKTCLPYSEFQDSLAL